MDAQAATGRTIWQREIDWERQASSRRKFVKYYVAPSALVMLIVLVAAGPWEMLGVLILTGLFGLLLGAYVELQNFNRRRLHTLRVIDGELVLEHNKQRVLIRNVQRFTTEMTSIQSTTYAAGTQVDGAMEAAAARFLVKLDEIRRGRLTDTSHDWIHFVWPLMKEEELETVRAAIEPELPVDWIDPDSFNANVEDGIGNVPPEQRHLL